MSFDALAGRRTRLTDLVIPQAGDATNFLDEKEYGGYDALAIYPVTGTYDGAMSLEVNQDPSADQGNDAQWTAYDPITPGVAVVPVSNRLIVIPAPPTHGFRIKSASAEDPLVTFRVWGINYGRS